MILPKILVAIYDYFEDENVKGLKAEHLFKKRVKNYEIDELERHFALGDYYFIRTIKNPYVVATYLKFIFKYLPEPLCTFEFYTMFYKICKGKYSLVF